MDTELHNLLQVSEPRMMISGGRVERIGARAIRRKF
jgi:hypothetical protein